MRAVAGRRDKYTTVIEPNFDYILKQLQNGATEKQIFSALGIAGDTWYKYKDKKTEFSDLIKKGRAHLVTDLRGALVKRAMGFEYQESRTYLDDTGNVERSEVYTKYAPPDVAALNLALKNYDKDQWANDPQMLDIRKEELEMKKKKAEEEDWLKPNE